MVNCSRDSVLSPLHQHGITLSCVRTCFCQVNWLMSGRGGSRWLGWLATEFFCFLHVQSCLTWKTILSLYSCGFWVYFFSCSRAGWLVGKFTHHHGSSWPESSIVCFSNACLLYFALAHWMSLWGLWSGWPGSKSAYVKMVAPQDRDVFRPWVHVVVYLDLTKPSKWFVVCCCNGWACRKSS